MQKIIVSFTIIFSLFILWVIYMANSGQGTVFFDWIKTIPMGDKLGHVVLFGILTLGFNLATKLRCVQMGKLKIYLGTLLVSLFVIIEELSQYFVPTRTMDVADLMADAVGILLFTAITYFFRKRGG